jgi:RHS repeat-associated protein
VTDSNGNTAARIIYGAWGEELYSNDTVPNGLDARFVGGLGVRNDAATGLIYMRHRWYDPETQRFFL